MEIGIIGYGRFGRFAAERLRQDFQVVVYDRKRVRCPRGVRSGSLEEVASRPLVLLCVPISAISKTCLEIKPYLAPGQLIIDTCSVKERPLQEMARLLPRVVEILGTHPLFGPDSARNGIRGLKIVLCPVRCRRVSKVKAWLEAKGLEVIVTTPARHDFEMSKTQALFHFLARGVAETGIRVGRLSTPGPAKLFEDFRDVQNDSLQLFQDLHRMNRFTAAVRKDLIDCLTQLDAELSDSSHHAKLETGRSSERRMKKWRSGGAS
ncbi:MAG TPA: prephenate dehydrogenase [Terriglobia bacterium]|nr:prephenate dehydrogenase [Terriglobia bacterium]